MACDEIISNQTITCDALYQEPTKASVLKTQVAAAFGHYDSNDAYKD